MSLESNLGQIAIIRNEINIMCNSMELFILHFWQVVTGQKLSGSFKFKIKQFNQKLDVFASKTTVKIDNLKIELLEFDATWTIVKHGNPVVNIVPPTFIYEGQTYAFPEEKMKELEQKFIYVQKDLLEIMAVAKKQ